MGRPLSVSEVRFTRAPQRLVPTGLLGRASFVIDGRLRVDGVSVRRTRSGRLALSYPVRDDGVGRRWEYLRPLDDHTRRELERQVLEQLGETAS